MNSIKLPVQNPVQPIIDSLQKCLFANGKATLQENPQGYFAFLGAHTHIQTSLKLLKALNEKGLFTKSETRKEDVDLLIKQLETLDSYEWV